MISIILRKRLWLLTLLGCCVFPGGLDAQPNPPRGSRGEVWIGHDLWAWDLSYCRKGPPIPPYIKQTRGRKGRGGDLWIWKLPSSGAVPGRPIRTGVGPPPSGHIPLPPVSLPVLGQYQPTLRTGDIDAAVVEINGLLTELRAANAISIHSVNELRAAAARAPALLTTYLRELGESPHGPRDEGVMRARKLVAGLEALSTTLVWMEARF